MDRKDYGHFYYAILLVSAAVLLYTRLDITTVPLVFVLVAVIYVTVTERRRREYIRGEIKSRNGIERLNAE